MSATVDANVLLYASDRTSRFHRPANALLRRLARGPELLYLSWPAVMGYLRIATHPAIFDAPLAPEEAIANVDALLSRPNVLAAGEGERSWRLFLEVAGEALPRGNLVPDAHLMALMRENGVRTLWTHDRDYRRFRGIEVRDPFA